MRDQAMGPFTEDSLHNRLTQAGLRSEPDRRTRNDGRRSIFHGNAFVGRFDAPQAWDLLRELSGQ